MKHLQMRVSPLKIFDYLYDTIMQSMSHAMLALILAFSTVGNFKCLDTQWAKTFIECVLMHYNRKSICNYRTQMELSMAAMYLLHKASNKNENNKKIQ